MMATIQSRCLTLFQAAEESLNHSQFHSVCRSESSLSQYLLPVLASVGGDFSLYKPIISRKRSLVDIDSSFAIDYLNRSPRARVGSRNAVPRIRVPGRAPSGALCLWSKNSLSARSEERRVGKEWRCRT